MTKLNEISVQKKIETTLDQEKDEIRMFQLDINYLVHKFEMALIKEDIKTNKIQKIIITADRNMEEFVLGRILDLRSVDPIVEIEIGFNFSKFFKLDNKSKEDYLFKVIYYALKKLFEDFNLEVDKVEETYARLNVDKDSDYSYKIMVTHNSTKTKKAYVKYKFTREEIKGYFEITDNTSRVINSKLIATLNPANIYKFYSNIGRIKWLNDDEVVLSYDKKKYIVSSGKT